MDSEGSQRNLRRAIRRSREARAAARRRRRRTLVLVASIAIALASASFFAFSGLAASDIAAAAVTKAQSLEDMINGRSPGVRSAGELIKTKHARALARVRAAPRTKAQSAIHSPIEQLASALQAPTPVTSVPELSPTLPLAELELGPPNLGAILVPGSGPGVPHAGSPPITFPGSEPKTPVPLPSAVPEPGSWATMLLGFAVVGFQIRRRRTRVAQLNA